MPRKDPEHCAHRQVNRVMDSWVCTDCGAEFKPKEPKYNTKWSDDEDV
jgi:ribosomal protein L37AE/L43A